MPRSLPVVIERTCATCTRSTDGAPGFRTCYWHGKRKFPHDTCEWWLEPSEPQGGSHV